MKFFKIKIFNKFNLVSNLIYSEIKLNLMHTKKRFNYHLTISLREWPAMYGSWTEIAVETTFRIYLRPNRRFYCAYLIRKGANSIFKILIDFPFRRDDFENRFHLKLFNDDHEKSNKKFYSKNEKIKNDS